MEVFWGLFCDTKQALPLVVKWLISEANYSVAALGKVKINLLLPTSVFFPKRDPALISLYNSHPSPAIVFGKFHGVLALPSQVSPTQVISV